MSADEFTNWGWRIAFVVAGPISLIGLYIRSRTEESETFKRIARQPESRRKASLLQSLREHSIKISQVFFIVALNALTFYLMVGYFVTFLQMTVSLTRTESLISNAAGLLTLAVFLPIAGGIADRVGRKPMLIVGSIAIALVSIPAFHLLTEKTLTSAILAQALVALGLSIYGGGSYAFFMEVFPTSIRLTGSAVSYNASYAIFGGTGPFVGAYLVHATGSSASPAYYLLAVAVVALLVATRVPETRGVNLDVGGTH